MTFRTTIGATIAARSLAIAAEAEALARATLVVAPLAAAANEDLGKCKH